MDARTTVRIMALAAVAASGAARADIILGYYDSPSTPASPETGDTIPAVKPKDKASMGLKMASDAQNTAFITNGDVPVSRGMVTNLGKNVAGTDTIVGYWDESVGTTTNSIQAVWTTLNGQPFLPVGHLLNGKVANLVEWRFGATDPVTFMDHITEIKLIAATVSWSYNGGISFQTASILPFFTNPWNGKDLLKMLPLAGVNHMFTLYEYEVVPAPSSFGLLAAAGVLAARRRR